MKELVDTHGQTKDHVLTVQIGTARTHPAKTAAYPVHESLSGPVSVLSLSLGLEHRLSLVRRGLVAVFGVISLGALAPCAPGCVEVFGLGRLFGLLSRPKVLLTPEVGLLGGAPTPRSALWNLARATPSIGTEAAGLSGRLLGTPMGGDGRR